MAFDYIDKIGIKVYLECLIKTDGNQILINGEELNEAIYFMSLKKELP